MLLLIGLVLATTPTFVKECEYQFQPKLDVDMVYQIGTVGGDDAFQMLLTYPSVMGSWAAVGFRGTGMAGQGMEGFGIVAFDSATDAVSEYALMLSDTKPTTPSAVNDAVFVERVQVQDKTTTTFFRKMTTGDVTDYSFTKGSTVNVALAIGDGTAGVNGNWQGHLQTNRDTANLTFHPCLVVPQAQPQPPQVTPQVTPQEPPQVAPQMAPVVVPEIVPETVPQASVPVEPPRIVPESTIKTPQPNNPDAPADTSDGGISMGAILAIVGGVVLLCGAIVGFYYYSRPGANSSGMNWNEMRDLERDIESTLDQAQHIRGEDTAANQGYKHMAF